MTVLPDLFTGLARALGELAEAVSAIHVSLLEDHPPGDASAIDDVDEQLQEAAWRLTEAAELASLAASAADDPASTAELRRVLTRCHELHLDAGERLRGGGTEARPDPAAALRRLAGQRRGDWISWAQVVSRGLSEYRGRADAIERLLLTCWQELVERGSSTGVHVQAVGQQLTITQRARRTAAR